MIKSFFAATALLVATASTAAAGPFYLNWSGMTVSSPLTIHQRLGRRRQRASPGLRGPAGFHADYIQGGPAYLQGNGVESETEISGKPGVRWNHR